MKKIIKESKNMKFLVALGPIAISKSVWSQLLDENEKGRSVTSFQDVSLDGNANFRQQGFWPLLYHEVEPI